MLRWVWPLSPAIVFGVAFYVLTRFVRRTPTIPGELSVDRSLTARAPASLVEVSHAVDVQHWVVVVLVLAACFLLARRFREAVLLLLAEPLADGLNLALKIAINRQFPDQGPVLGWDRLDTLLFPSGHVVRTTVTLGLLVAFVAWPHARLRWPATGAALALIGLISVTQVTVGGHLPLDAVGGFLLAGILVNLLYVIDRVWAGDGAMLRPRTGPRIIVTELGRARSGFTFQPALPGSSFQWKPSTTMRLRSPTTVGLVMALVIAAVGLRAPQRLWHLASEPSQAASWPRVLVSEAAQQAESLRNWVSRTRRTGSGSS